MTVTAKIQNTAAAKLLFCVLLSLPGTLLAQQQYQLRIRLVDKDSVFMAGQASLKTVFSSRQECAEYVNRIPAVLKAKGFANASVDSVFFDSTAARIVLYPGKMYHWATIDISKTDPSLLSAIGWNEKMLKSRPADFELINQLREKMLNHLENNGYPFAKIYLDSLQVFEDSIRAFLVTDKGPLYKIDSIRVYGDVNVSNNFLQRYLEIPNGSIYSKEKLLGITPKLLELTYVQEEKPSDLTLLGTGSVLNLYLKPRKSSQVNVLVGFLPKNDQLSSKKLLITGEANINLRNALGAGETIGLNWQQIQVKSPRLNIFYQHPFLFNSPVGLDFGFDMFKKDSTFLNINLQVGARYIVARGQTGKLFIQRFQTVLSQGGINTSQIIQTRRLPDVADVSSFNAGVEYDINRTNYRLNPRSGTAYRLMVAAGTKNVRKNNEILELKDPGDPSFDFAALYDTVKLKTYQFRFSGMTAKYFPLGKQGTIKTSLNGGVFYSDNIFRNELFQIGGYKLLRGFDEESQYVSQYAVATLEYRYLIGLNSYFFVFTDGGWARNTSRISKYSHRYFGTGMGLALETKAGIFNLAWAVGKRDDTPFNLRQSKIHFGFVNYF